MNVGPTEAGNLTFWEYTALKAEWNRGRDDPNDEVEAPDRAFVEARFKELENSPISGKAH